MTGDNEKARCPRCEANGNKYGTKARRTLELDANGRPAISSVRMQRWKCPGCGAAFTTGFDPAAPQSLASIKARDAVAEACCVRGYAQVAHDAGIDVKTVRSLWKSWADIRESDLPERAPEFLGLHVVTLSGAERTVVTDVSSMTLVDVLEGVGLDAVGSWLARIGYPERIDTVAIAVNQRLRAAVEELLPDVRLMVCPRHAGAAGANAYLVALRGARRRLGHGSRRNVTEDVRTFARPRRNLDAEQVADMEAWAPSILDLYEAKESFANAFSAVGEFDARKAFGAAASVAHSAGAHSASDLVEQWKSPFAVGVAVGGTGIFCSRLDGFATAWPIRRPCVPFDLTRAAAVLSDGARDVRDDCGFLSNRGVPLDDLAFRNQIAA